jgi:LAGLIDADG DNA endonuclease family
MLRFEQGKKHEKYILHLYDLFKDFCNSKPKHSTRKLDLRTGKIYNRITFQTRSLSCFNEYQSIFYNFEGIKIIPHNIMDLLTPRGLAY